MSAGPAVTVYEPSAVAAANEDAAGDAQPEDEHAEEKVPAEHETTIQTAIVDEPQPGGKTAKTRLRMLIKTGMKLAI